MTKTNSHNSPSIHIDPSLDRYEKLVLFPDKLKKANENLEKSGFPGSIKQSAISQKID